MTFLPIVERELRVAARQRFTHGLRVLGVGGLTIASLVFGLQNGFTSSQGGALFAELHLTLFFTIWVLVPLLPADCISRERREGTLGLLLLTPLRATELVVAKGFSQALRALTLWLAVLPVLAIPVLLGGVSWPEAALSAFINFSAVCLALSAGLLASSLTSIRGRVLLCAGCLCLVLGVGFLLVQMILLLLSAGLLSSGLSQLGESGWETLLEESLALATNRDDYWAMLLARMGVPGRNQVLLGLGATSLLSFFASCLAVRFAASRVRRVWREEPPSARMLWLHDRFCRPVFFQGFYQRWMQARRYSNPIGWLERRTWSGRLMAWSWLAVVACVCTAVATGSGVARALGGAGAMHLLMALLLGSLVLSAAGSFRRERETGVLELLLVSPLTEDQIIGGRLRGLWGQFLPAGGLLLIVWLFLQGTYRDLPPDEETWFCAASFVCLPVIGLFQSLRNRSLISALLTTLAFGVLLPLILCCVLSWYWWAFGGGREVNFSGHLFSFGWGSVCQVGVAVFCWLALCRRLRERSFPLEKTLA